MHLMEGHEALHQVNKAEFKAHTQASIASNSEPSKRAKPRIPTIQPHIPKYVRAESVTVKTVNTSILYFMFVIS
jgi:hypothetical protein